MPFTDCPKCLARVRYPDTPVGESIRCTKCNQSFLAPAPPAAPTTSAASPSTPATVLAAAPAAPPIAPHDDPFDYSRLERAGRILSAADEALLREMGSGTGLLDMTSEALQTGDAPHRPDDVAGGLGGGLSDRQFQIVGTALTMANKLTEVYKAELARTRRLSLAVWSACALILIAGLVAFGWGMAQSNAVKLEQSKTTSSTQNVELLKAGAADLRTQIGDLKTQAVDLKAQAADLQTRYGEEKSRAAALTADLKTAQTELQATKADLQTAKTELQAAKTRLAELQSQLDSRAAATLPASSAGPIVRP